MLNQLNQRGIRWASYLLLAIIFRVILDVVFGLVYRNYELLQPLTAYFFSIVITATVFESIFYLRIILDRRTSWKDKPYQRFLLQWILSFLIAVFVVFGLRWAYVMVFVDFTYVSLQNEVIILIQSWIIITGVTLVDLSWFLLDRWRFSLAELERFKKENAEFRFESLRSQINPHFLFNSLNTLSSLVHESPDKASDFIRELSDVYRYVLENRSTELIEFKKELEMAKSYIYLVKLRFDKNVSFDVHIENTCLQKKVAPLSLQLLIENAVKHNIVSRNRPLKISVRAAEGYVTVSNTLQKKASKEYSSQLGLKNISNRYSFLTDKEVKIIETIEKFEVSIPLLEK